MVLSGPGRAVPHDAGSVMVVVFGCACMTLGRLGSEQVS